LNTVAEKLLVKIQKWGYEAIGISCILQMDVDTIAENDTNGTPTKSLKIMLVTDMVDAYMQQPVWLEQFGSYSKCHKADHGFFQILKASYDCGVTISFIIINANDKRDIYTFCEVEDLEKSVSILVRKD
jgi:hypothetical protein